MGLEPDDDAAKWLEQADPAPPPAVPKAARKSVTLHRWRQAQLRSKKDAG